MITLNNRKQILFYYFLSILFFITPLAVVLYLNYSEFLIIGTAFSIFMLFIRFFFLKYSEIKTYSDHIVIKIYSIAGKTPIHFSPIAFVDIKSFHIDEKEKKIVFQTEFEQNSRMTSYSVKYFRDKQLSKLRTVLSEYIKNKNLRL